MPEQAFSSEDKIVILDFGSQYTQVIARRVRECRVYSEILPFWTKGSVLRESAPKGIILSGGPSSVYDKAAPLPDAEIFKLGIPVLGICYGLQILALVVREPAGLDSADVAPSFDADLIVDAILGTGFRPPISPLYEAAIAKMNAGKSGDSLSASTTPEVKPAEKSTASADSAKKAEDVLAQLMGDSSKNTGKDSAGKFDYEENADLSGGVRDYGYYATMAAFGRPTYYDEVRRLITLRDDGGFEIEQSCFEFLTPFELPYTEEFLRRFGEPREPEADFAIQRSDLPKDLTDAEAAQVVSNSRHYANLAASVQLCTEGVALPL